MATSYSNDSLQVHELVGTPYHESPAMYINIATGNTSRSGDTVNLTINSASLRALGGLSYFGYTIEVLAQLDNGTAVSLFNKAIEPNQWGEGVYKLASPVTISSTNSTTSTQLKILFKSNCNCNNGEAAVVQTISLDAPAVPPTTYIVTFLDWDSTVLQQRSINSGESDTPPADPVREGYTFTGWSGDYTNVTSDRTIIAQYQSSAYIYKRINGEWVKQLKAHKKIDGSWTDLPKLRRKNNGTWE